MAKEGSSFFDFNYLDILASGNTIIHRIDPRAKVLTTVLFIISIVSFAKYEVSSLLPFLLFPVVMVAMGNIPAGYLLKKILYLSPFILFVAIFNPLLDTSPMTAIGNHTISGGWVSFFSIILRFFLTVAAALALIATTGFYQVCMAAEKLGLPKAFAVQLLFLYRYIFVLGDEVTRVLRARALRSFGNRGRELKVFASIAGTLFLRTWDRAQRIHMAMLCRGFRGEFHFGRPPAFGKVDVFFLLGWAVFFVVCRSIDIPAFIGGIFSEVFT